ncbi:solute carrier family 34 (sodium-dependent phosphate cotransporter) [Algoriphagus faecimaris]|uniref:Solute carrier family 34 (Sodium-dependent phosphate cotransporter) n=1 Tax=Algoriphagus faecimaris TaxID=686796 RepID=A0A1G6SXD2_9BACT|nr:Na/Pi symporter [Algoriphagus faecimaris]SDD21401.1 solute carrier family 34 (sodium-dependent phosphate cotransporter) [Algoriphagus faecimaris]
MDSDYLNKSNIFPLNQHRAADQMESWDQEIKKPNPIQSYLLMLIALLLFIFSIDMLTVSMRNLNSSVSEELFSATQNPFISLFIGLLMTALIQSSSTVTASIVAVVASGSISLQQAVPMVMGANIGTTLTSTLVSFSFIMKKKEFKRALSAGILHDVFNIFTVLLLLPLELYFQILSKSAVFLAGFFTSNEPSSNSYITNTVFTRPLTEWVNDAIGIPFLTTLVAVFLVFAAIKLLATSVYKTFVQDSFRDINKIVFKKTGMALIYGIFFTAAVQSSTVTTSLIVPLVANRKVSLKKVFPFIIGANIGTTITAAIAAVYKSEAAIALAIVHFLFNTIGAIVILSIPPLRVLPVRLALYMGKKSVKTRFLGFAYILLTFFIIPFLLIYFSTN